MNIDDNDLILCFCDDLLLSLFIVVSDVTDCLCWLTHLRSGVVVSHSQTMLVNS